jgi:hypothetical protein
MCHLVAPTTIVTASCVQPQAQRARVGLDVPLVFLELGFPFQGLHPALNQGTFHGMLEPFAMVMSPQPSRAQAP